MVETGRCLSLWDKNDEEQNFPFRIEKKSQGDNLSDRGVSNSKNALPTQSNLSVEIILDQKVQNRSLLLRAMIFLSIFSFAQ